jgi:hypothetical protein
MRPPISGWFDSTIRVWRPTTVKDELQAESRTYVEVDTYGAAINRSKMSEAFQGGGMTPVGSLRWYGEPTIDVQPRDVCEILTGPDSGLSWEVNAPPVRPRGHHTQVDCIEWHGVLPTADVS